MNFRNRLLVLIIPSILLLMGGLATFIEISAGNNLIESQKLSMERSIRQIRSGVDRWIDSRRDEISILSKDQAVRNVFSDPSKATEVQLKLTELFDTGKNYSSVLLFDKTGVITFNSVKGRSVGKAYAHRDGFKKAIAGALSGEVTFDVTRISPATGEPIVLVAAPVKVEGRVVGVAGGVILLQKVTDIFIRDTKYGSTGYPYIINSEGLVVSHPDKKNILKLDISKIEWGPTLLSQKTGEISYGWGEAKKFAMLDYSPTRKWVFAASMDDSEFYAELKKGFIVATITTIVSVLILTLITFLATNNVFLTVKNVSIGVTDGAREIFDASSQLTSSSSTLSSSATQQASSVEETSASLEELTNMVENNLDGARHANELAEDMHKMSLTADEHIVGLAESMNKLKLSNEEVKQLVDIIKEISHKAAVIDDIVFQTKLLSFNASVEAERAGEHGRGFAVVAQEVGNLAQMSGNAANEISQILSRSIKAAEKITDANERNVLDGSKKVGLIDEVVKKVLDSSKGVATNASSITQASEEQHLGLKQITEAVSTLDQSIQETTSIANKSAVASEQLRGQSTSLNNLIGDLNQLVTGQKGTKREVAPAAPPSEARESKKESIVSSLKKEDCSSWEAL